MKDTILLYKQLSQGKIKTRQGIYRFGHNNYNQFTPQAEFTMHLYKEV